MEITIKEFNVKMEVKNNGIELEIHDNDGSHLGDLIINKRRMEWCQGKTTRGNGKKLSWNKLVELFDTEGHD